MKYRQLGRTSLKLSEISVGCSGFWGNKLFSEKKAENIIFEAAEKGVNFFDTGHNYSEFNAEPRLGRILNKLFEDHDRSSFVISSKAGTTIPRASLVKSSVPTTNFSPKFIRDSCLMSIDNLKCDYLDVFQLHAVSQREISEALIDELLQMKADGLYRYLGINIHCADDIQYVAEHPEIFDLILLDYNVLQIDREPLIEKLYAAGVGVIAGTVLAQGHLIRGKVGRLRSISDIWYLARALLKPGGRRFLLNSKKMKKLLSGLEGLTAVQAAFLYVLNNPCISSCVFGTTSTANLNEVLSVVDNKISDEVIEFIRNTFYSSGAVISQ